MMAKEKKSKTEYKPFCKDAECRAEFLERLASDHPKWFTSEEQLMLLECARFQRSWSKTIHKHSQSEQMRNMSLSGSMLKIIQTAAEALAPWSKDEQLNAWMEYKKIGGKRK